MVVDQDPITTVTMIITGQDAETITGLGVGTITGMMTIVAAPHTGLTNWATPLIPTPRVPALRITDLTEACLLDP